MCRGAGVGCGVRVPEEKVELPEASIEAPCIKRAQESDHLGASQILIEPSEGKGHADIAVTDVGRTDGGLVQGSMPGDDSIFIIKKAIFFSFLNTHFCTFEIYLLLHQLAVHLIISSRWPSGVYIAAGGTMLPCLNLTGP